MILGRLLNLSETAPSALGKAGVRVHGHRAEARDHQFVQRRAQTVSSFPQGDNADADVTQPRAPLSASLQRSLMRLGTCPRWTAAPGLAYGQRVFSLGPGVARGCWGSKPRQPSASWREAGPAGLSMVTSPFHPAGSSHLLTPTCAWQGPRGGSC